MGERIIVNSNLRVPNLAYKYRACVLHQYGIQKIPLYYIVILKVLFHKGLLIRWSKDG
jgi:hypothetical protein